MPDVIHEPGQQRFILQQEGASCVLDYRIDGTRINFTHTFVPPELRGKGLAEKLVRRGLKWADEQQLSKEADCWYVARFLR
ncbi:MAG TPA: N-acetyltransferase [Oceanospirillales bacterium]|nr:GNAT family N-acetyltransferase [Oceanospirillaceae bacterium]HBS42647.1 N-acetyltransferase [Oceanospirillales bacterium]|tara:strand:- start:261 stop:503 length:243 start_codon:yes stop_codon:yes gene_type:complete